MIDRLRWVAWGCLERLLERLLGGDDDPFTWNTPNPNKEHLL